MFLFEFLHRMWIALADIFGVNVISRWLWLLLVGVVLNFGGLSVALGFSCDEVTEIPKVECEALVAFYDSTGGDNWKDNAGWKVTNTPCNWKGIDCKNGKVTGLYLNYNNLVGTIPNIPLPALTSLSLSNNELSGSIPNFGNLSALTSLSLSNNKLSGSLPNFTAFNLADVLSWRTFQKNCGLTAYDATQEFMLLKYKLNWNSTSAKCELSKPVIVNAANVVNFDPERGILLIPSIKVEGVVYSAELKLLSINRNTQPTTVFKLQTANPLQNYDGSNGYSAFFESSTGMAYISTVKIASNIHLGAVSLKSLPSKDGSLLFGSDQTFIVGRQIKLDNVSTSISSQGFSIKGKTSFNEDLEISAKKESDGLSINVKIRD